MMFISSMILLGINHSAAWLNDFRQKCWGLIALVGLSLE